MVFSCGTRACPKLCDRRVTNDPESTITRNTCRVRNLKSFRDGKQMPAGSKEKVSSDESAQCRAASQRVGAPTGAGGIAARGCPQQKKRQRCAAACQGPRPQCLTSECHFRKARAFSERGRKTPSSRCVSPGFTPPAEQLAVLADRPVQKVASSSGTGAARIRSTVGRQAVLRRKFPASPISAKPNKDSVAGSGVGFGSGPGPTCVALRILMFQAVARSCGQ